MAQESVTKKNAANIDPENDLSLLRESIMRAWTQFTPYDETAASRKKLYVNGRQRILILTFLATVAAIATSLSISNTLGTFVALIAAILPLVGSYWMNDIVQFIGTTDWIYNRYAAERIRQEIYLFRARAGDYNVPLKESDNVLSQKLRAIREEMQGKITLPALSQELIGAKAIEAHVNPQNKTSMFYTGESDPQEYKDDGLSYLDGDTYMKARLEPQQRWYQRKSTNTFAEIRRFHRYSQGALLIGSIIGVAAGILNREVVILIAVTNATAEFATTWSGISLFGNVHSIFMLAAQRLSSLHFDYITKKNDFDDAGKLAELSKATILEVENILAWERERWYEHVLQVQVEIDEGLINDLNQFIKDKDKEHADNRTDNPVNADDPA